MTRGIGLSASDGVAHANGGSGGNAQRDHIGEGNGVERNLVARKSDGSQAADKGGGESEDADFQGDLNGCGKPQRDKAADASEVNIDRSLEQLGAVTAIVPEQIADEYDCQIQAGNGCGPARTHHAHRGSAPFAVDENPIEEGVDDVGAHEREGNRLGHVHGLQAASDSEIKQERKKAEGQRLHVGNGERGELRFDVQTPKKRSEQPNWKHQEGRHHHAQINAVDQRAVAVFAAARAEGLRDEGIEANEETATEEG